MDVESTTRAPVMPLGSSESLDSYDVRNAL
jgi:hypothetical protein